MAGIFFFDGDCGLCAGAIHFLRARDNQGRLEFYPLQSSEALKLLPSDLTKELQTAVYLSKKNPTKYYLRSDAILGALREIGGAWRGLAITLGLVPKALRDWCYDRVAANRHRCSWKKPDAL